VPEGTIGITFDVQGALPLTVAKDPAKFHLSLPEIQKMAKTSTYDAIVQGTAQEYKQARLAGDNGPLIGLAWVALWTAYEHPKSGKSMRDAVSAVLRETGKAHITWHYDDNGLAMALADRFIDLDQVVANTPKDRITMSTTDPDAEPRPH
jgi:hypothetical protein